MCTQCTFEVTRMFFKILTKVREELTNCNWNKKQTNKKKTDTKVQGRVGPCIKPESIMQRQEQKGVPSHHNYRGRKIGEENFSLTTKLPENTLQCWQNSWKLNGEILAARIRKKETIKVQYLPKSLAANLVS